MRVLITGAGGMLGTDLQQVISRQSGHEVVPYRREELNIADREQVLAVIQTVRPDVIVNAAAYTDVDGCETNRELADSVNAMGPANLAMAASAVGAKLIHVSTDYVFAGDRDVPYVEIDDCAPQSVYGQSKWAGEEAIRKHTAQHFILRSSWLFGLHGKNFVSTMLSLGTKQRSVRVVNDQWGSPTCTWDLARAIVALFESDRYGTYHVTNAGACTWFDFAKLIFAEEGLQVEVLPIRTEELGRIAPRPAYSVLDNRKWVDAGFASLRSYEEALREHLRRWHEGGSFFGSVES